MYWIQCHIKRWVRVAKTLKVLQVQSFIELYIIPLKKYALIFSDYKSIGKFCSNNLVGSSLFNMYSPDGHAKIKFRSDGSKTGRGFKLTYRLRNINSNYLPGYYFSDCSRYVLCSFIFKP